ncbi:hypothetical protein [Mucilaginibacter ginkgonis]|uniref:Uncharacterized protein n=1 Tax=Mucilaginibacter ginkgonis TaxID=2682091 RepID=A0A6I4IMJ3_9SPHI|nr:hypothetical protein [Mucilaginibacter ginkgonis]QQL50213.1 hypothetical protein GO620_001810 [Mucilaginibacter ginkgonis]
MNLLAYLKDKECAVFPYLREKLNSSTNFNYQKGNVIVHLAGKAHDAHNTGNPYDFNTVNYGIIKSL